MEAFVATAEAVLADQHVSSDVGLPAGEVVSRRAEFGPNLLTSAGRKSIFSILFDQFNSVIVLLLVASGAVSLFLGDVAEALAIAVVLIINFLIGFFTELKAIRSMEALRRIARVSTRVRRDGYEKTIGASELVPGDIVLLEEGNVVTADLRLTKVFDLRCDESVLTGESAPVIKDVAKLPPDIVIGDRINMAFKGSAVTRGVGEGVVVKTGMATQLGRISQLAQTAESEVPPLERRLDRLGHRLVWLTLFLALATILAGLVHGYAPKEMFQTGVALAVAAVPEGLPVVATLTLARGMWRMAARNALISNMPAVETLGATTVIMTDKTGTLTENRMTVTRFLLPAGDVDFTDARATGLAQGPSLEKALLVGALCSASAVDEGEDDPDAPGDPMERALFEAARFLQTPRAELLKTYPRTDLYPFASDLKMMATQHRGDTGFLVAVKGAPEAVISRCKLFLDEDGNVRPLDEASRSAWLSRATAAAEEGLRLLGLAFKSGDDPGAGPYEDLALIGLVCLLDPIRSNVPQALRAARDAGVRVIMVTGDHVQTAATIARHAGLTDHDLTVLEGKEIGDVSPAEITNPDRDRLLAADVFARVGPETKLQLATLHQKNGEIVAMTGDGVNDAPALKKADIGIAMGQRGTEVAREAADMVLKDDNFATIIAAMEQGRIILDNIRTFVLYLMSCNVSEILVVGFAVSFGLPTPLLPLQILFLNLVTDVFPAFALGLGQGDPGVMKRPPRDPSESVLTAVHWVTIGVLGSLITVLTLGAFTLALFWLELPVASAVTVSFLTLSLAQLWNVFNMRAPESGILANEVTRNPFVWIALVFCIGLIMTALWQPDLAQILGLENPGPAGLGLALAASVLHLLLGQIALGTRLLRSPEA